MKEGENFDVMVAGAGPGGAAAAKRCAESGLKTLLVEKRKLPRDKVCSGMIMGKWALQIIEEEFGEIPESVLTDSSLLSGHRFYVGAKEMQELKWPTALSWRKDLDFWLAQSAAKSGANLRDGVRVSGVEMKQDGDCRITLQEGKKTEILNARFVIGADGASSLVRRSLFPDLKVHFSGPIRECYQGSLIFPKRSSTGFSRRIAASTV